MPRSPEPPAVHRPVIVGAGDTVRLDLPPKADGGPAYFQLRIVAVAGEPVPFLEIDTERAFAPGAEPLWAFTIDGRRLTKFTANTGGTHGTRLSHELVAAGFTIRIWSEEHDRGAITSGPFDVQLGGSSEP